MEELAQMLQVNAINAVPYHAGLDAKTRAKNQDLFLKEDFDVVVATIAFGMGIDKPDVRFVIHHDILKVSKVIIKKRVVPGETEAWTLFGFLSYKDTELEKLCLENP